GEGQEGGRRGQSGGGEACERSPTSASFDKENRGREDGEGDQIREREAHAFEGAGAEENSEPGEPVPAVSHRKQPPENQGQREPGGYVDDGVGVHDPGGPSERGGPRDPRSEDPAPAISESIDRRAELLRGERGVVGDLGVEEAVVPAGVPIDVDRQLPERRDLGPVV